MMAYWVGKFCPLVDLSTPTDKTDYGMSYVSNDAQFRFPIGLQILFAITTFLGTIVLPESPRWVSQTLLESLTSLMGVVDCTWQAGRRPTYHLGCAAKCPFPCH